MLEPLPPLQLCRVRVFLFQHAFLKIAQSDSELMQKACKDMRCNAVLTSYSPSPNNEAGKRNSTPKESNHKTPRPIF